MDKNKTRYFFYKLVADNGGAPCPYKNILSLAICKPMIRTSAKKGDVIFGFGGKKLQNRIIYVAVVEKVVTDYYINPLYKDRPDCIYKNVAGKYQWKESAQFHEEGEFDSDVGKFPDYKRTKVILSNDFRYLGREGTDDYLRNVNYTNIANSLKNLKRGHRVNHLVKLRDELEILKMNLWKKYSKKIIGKPSDQDKQKSCNECEGNTVKSC